MFLLLLACRTYAVEVPVDSAQPGGGDTATEQEPAPFEPELADAVPLLTWGTWDCGAPQWVVADAGPSLWVSLGEEVSLDAGLQDGETASWALLQGEAALEVAEGQLRFTPTQEGLYALRLIVDSAQDQDKDRVLVQVGGELAPPTAVVPDVFDLALGDEVTLDSAGSTGPEGVDLRTVWTLVDAPVDSAIQVQGQEGQSLSFTPDEPGVYTFRAEVSAGAVTDKATVRVAVQGRAVPPGYLSTEPVILSATGLPGWQQEHVVKWAGVDGPLDAERMPERYGACVPLRPQQAGRLDLKVVFEDPDSGEVIARHYPSYTVLDGPKLGGAVLQDSPEALAVLPFDGALVLRSGAETVLLKGSLAEGFVPFGPESWGWGGGIFAVAEVASGAVVVADRGPVHLLTEPTQTLGSGRDRAFVLEDPAGDVLLVDGVLYDAALEEAAALRRGGAQVRLDEAVSADLNGDGLGELVLIERVGPDQFLRRFEGLPAGSVEVLDADSVQVLFKGGLSTGDLDGDGYGELLLANGDLYRIAGGPTPLLEPALWVDGGGVALSAPQLADVSGDGALDLLLQGEGISINEANSGATWVLEGPVQGPVELLRSDAQVYAGSPEQRLGPAVWTGSALIGASWDGLWLPEAL